MTTIGIIYKKEDPIIAGTAAELTRELKKTGYKIDLNKAEFVITLGGLNRLKEIKGVNMDFRFFAGNLFSLNQ